jgi:hypothetical protein
MHPLPRSPDLRHVPRGVGMIAMALFTVLLLLGHGAMQPEVATAQQGRGPYVSPPVKPVVFDKDLRTLPKAPPGRTDRPEKYPWAFSHNRLLRPAQAVPARVVASSQASRQTPPVRR